MENKEFERFEKEVKQMEKEGKLKAVAKPLKINKKNERNERIGLIVIWGTKILLSLFLAFTFLLGVQALGARTKKLFYRNTLEGIETFEQTCELANHTTGGCVALANVIDEQVEWSCRPSNDKKKTICEIKIKGEEVQNEN